MSIVIVGEFPTLNESGTGPFTNGLWRYFKALLGNAGINPRDCIWLNVVNKPAASMYALCQQSKSGAYPYLPYLERGHYLRAEFGHDIATLYSALARIKPNLVIAVGDMPLWALAKEHGMGQNRGRITRTIPEAGGLKMLPVMHPRAVQAAIQDEPILKMDLAKAARESKFPEIRRPQRFIHIYPSLDDLEEYWQLYLADAPLISTDIETKGNTITCVGFSASPDRALVVPFFSEATPDGNYWKTQRDEVLAWRFVKRVVERPEARLLGQNFLFDIQQLLRKMGIVCPGYAEDTMLLHHTLQPELLKGLGFQGSIYTDECKWKTMNHRAAADRSGKKEDME